MLCKSERRIHKGGRHRELQFAYSRVIRLKIKRGRGEKKCEPKLAGAKGRKTVVGEGGDAVLRKEERSLMSHPNYGGSSHTSSNAPLRRFMRGVLSQPFASAFAVLSLHSHTLPKQ